MSSNHPFTPKTVGTVGITNSTSSANVALVPLGANQVRVKNIDATNSAFVAFGASGVAATVPNGATPGSFPVGPGESIIVSISPAVTHAASIAAAGTPIVYFTSGNVA